MSWVDWAICITMGVLAMPVFKWLDSQPQWLREDIEDWQRQQAKQAAEKARSRRLRLRSLSIKRSKK